MEWSNERRQQKRQSSETIPHTSCTFSKWYLELSGGGNIVLIRWERTGSLYQFFSDNNLLFEIDASSSSADPDMTKGQVMREARLKLTPRRARSVDERGTP